MFGHQSSSGSIDPLYVLTALAFGALLTPLNCTVTQAQEPDLNLRLTNADILPFQDDESDEAVLTTVLLKIPLPVNQTRSLRGGGTSGSSATAVSSTTQGSRGSPQHPAWVTDLESKTWTGFLTGLPGYEAFVMPVGMPMYFEDPFITTDLRLLYMHHEIPGGSALGRGQVHVAAAQIRLALTERLALMVTKGGYSWVDSRETPAGDGWNDWALGLKYAVYSKPDDQFLVSTGLRWELTNGSTDAWQGGDSQELSPFVSLAKGWDKWHFLGALSGRIPMDRNDANASIVWNLHLDYELTETFRPLIELHGIHYLSNADAFPYTADYLDVGSLGATGVRGSDFFSAGFGFRWQAAPNISVGLTYELPLESSSENLQEHRITFNTVVSF